MSLKENDVYFEQTYQEIVELDGAWLEGETIEQALAKSINSYGISRREFVEGLGFMLCVDGKYRKPVTLTSR